MNTFNDKAPKHQRDDSPEVQARLAATDEEKKLLSRRKLVAGLVGGAVLAGSAALGIREATKQEATPAPQPTNSATENPTASTEPTTEPTASETQPSASETQLSREELIQKAEIPAGLSDEEYAKTFTEDRMTAWDMYGATMELADEWLMAGEGSEALLRGVAADGSDIYTSALFKTGWESEPSLYDYATYAEDQAYIGLLQYVKTTSPDAYPDDIEPLRVWYTVEDSRRNSTPYQPTDGGRVVDIIIVQHNNNEKNRYKDNPDVVALNGDKSLFTLTTTVEDGVEKISSMVRQDIPQDYSF